MTKAQRLNIYLLRDTFASLQEAQTAWDADGNSDFTRVEAHGQSNLSVIGYFREVQDQTPAWAAWLADELDFAGKEPLSRAPGFVSFVDQDGRVFALTFGTGWASLPSTMIEPDFGLKVALSAVDPAQLRDLITRNMSTRTRQRRTYLHAGGELVEFDVNTGAEWLRSAGGTPSAGPIEGTISGADSVKISVKKSLSEIGPVLSWLLGRFASKDYQVSFDFLDNVRPLRDQGEIAKLQLQLEKALNAKSLPKGVQYELVLPIEYVDSAESYRFLSERKSFKSEQLNAEALGELRKQKKVSLGLEKTTVVLLDANGDETKRLKLGRCLVAEVRVGTEVFLLNDGVWLQTSKDYEASIDDRLASLPVFAQALPPWSSGNEGAYNESAARTMNWLNQDQKNVSVGGGRNKVEPCDLLTTNQEFICVKQAHNSAALSHLFFQAIVSAELFRDHSGFRKVMQRRYKKNFKSTLNNPRYVLAIRLKEGRTLPKDLFFFSKLALLNAFDRIRGIGWSCEMAQIPWN